MSTPPPPLNVPTNVSPELARQASQAWSVAMAQQRVCVVLGLQPSPFAFIHRRTGTFYVFHPNVGAFAAKIDQHAPLAYIDAAALEPWETDDNPLPGPELVDSQLQLPAVIGELPESPTENRWLPYYGGIQRLGARFALGLTTTGFSVARCSVLPPATTRPRDDCVWRALPVARTSVVRARWPLTTVRATWHGRRLSG